FSRWDGHGALRPDRRAQPLSPEGSRAYQGLRIRLNDAARDRPSRGRLCRAGAHGGPSVVDAATNSSGTAATPGFGSASRVARPSNTPHLISYLALSMAPLFLRY